MNRTIAAVFVLASLLLVSASASATDKPPADVRDGGPDSIDVSKWPPEQQARYPLFQMKCGRCHPLARAVNARFDAPDWKRYAKKMIRRPNSGVNDTQAAELYQFLAYYASVTGAK
jgi:hypothetical protein